MKPQLIKARNQLPFSFSIRQDVEPDSNNKLHFHSEVELIQLHRGSGMQFIGDNVKSFSKGDILLIGSNLPHRFQFENVEPENDHKQGPYSTVIHFNEYFWTIDFLNLPENMHIKNALTKAKRGILVSAQEEPMISAIIENIVDAKGHYRISLLMDALALIGASNYSQQLASYGFGYNIDEIDRQRLSRIYDYSYANFRGNIPLNAIAQIASLTPNSFCRYFKKKANRTYAQFLNEIKVSHACKFLVNSEMNVKEICFESGFNNFSSFHDAFKKIQGVTPLEFRKAFI